MNKLLIALFAVLMIGVSTAYALEDVTNRVNIETDFNYNYYQCIQGVDDELPITVCTLYGLKDPTDTNGKPSGGESSDGDTSPKTCPDRFELIENECIPIITGSGGDKSEIVTETFYASGLTPEDEELFERYESDKEYCKSILEAQIILNESNFEEISKKIGSNSDRYYCAKVDQLDICQRGTGSAKGIQNEDLFVTSKSTLYDDRIQYTPIEFKGDVGKLEKAVEACDAQKNILEPITLGRETLEKGEYFGVPQPYHAEQATVDSDKWPQIPLHKDWNLTWRDYFETNEDAKKIMCASTATAEQFKDDYGCPKIVKKGSSGQAPTQNGSWDLSTRSLQPMPNNSDYLPMIKKMCYDKNPDCELPDILDKIKKEEAARDFGGGQ